MKIDRKNKTLTFTRSTFDKTYKAGDIVPLIPGFPTALDRHFVLVQRGPKTQTLYKLRQLKNGDTMLFHAFTGTPSLLSCQKKLVVLATLKQNK